jgi:preprotein translocase subunit Sec63
LGKLTGSLTMNKVSWFSFSKHLQSLLQDQPDN